MRAGGFFLHCLEEPARTGHPGALQGTLFSSPPHPNLHHRSPRQTLRGRISSVTRSGSPRKWRGRRGRRPPSPSLRPHGQSKKSPEKAPRPRQTCSLPSCRPQPRTSGGQGGAQSHTGSPKTPRGPDSRPHPERRSGAARGLSVFAADSAERRHSRAERHPPAGQSGAADGASRPCVPSRCPRPDTQPQTCGLSRPRARLRTGNGGSRPAGRGRRGPRGRGRTTASNAPREKLKPSSRGASCCTLEMGGWGSHRPGEGARRGGWATEAAPIGPGSRPSARATSPSRGAPPRLVRRRPEGSGALPAAGL